jgi:hypothetical protein
MTTFPRVHVLPAAERLEHAWKERVLMPVVHRDLRRRAHDDDDPRRVDPQLGEHRVVGLEVRQVVLLLEPRVLGQLAAVHPVLAQPLRRDGLGDHHSAGQAAADVVLLAGPLVVERVQRRDAVERGGQREVVGAVRDRQVEALAAPAGEPERPVAQRERLAGHARARVPADRRVGQPETLDDLEGLSIVARGHLDFVTRGLKTLDDRSEYEWMRGRGHVEPNPHRGRAGR